MKVIHFSWSDVIGGAAKATYNLVKHLEKYDDIENNLIVLKKETDDYFISHVYSNSYISKMKANFMAYFDLSNMLTKSVHGDPEFFWSANLFGHSTSLKLVRSADIVCLYWICYNFLTPRLIAKILSSNKPVVWRLSDMWPFTGGCHYAGDCKKYENEFYEYEIKKEMVRTDLIVRDTA